MIKRPATIELVASVLEGYASRGVFRGFSRGPVRNGKASFKMMWHQDRLFEFLLDPSKHTMRIPVVLPEVPARSSMYQEYKKFVESRHSNELPEHRRIDPGKVRIRCSNRGGNASLTAAVNAGDYEYGARKLIHVVHETFLDFLRDGRYYDYMVETFDLDPDKM